jgi:hypothetical protein
MIVSATGQFLEDKHGNQLFKVVAEEVANPTTGTTYDFHGNGSKTEFVLDGTFITILDSVTVDGVVQAEGTDFELVGNNLIRFATAPANGSLIRVTYANDSAYKSLYYTLGVRNAQYTCGRGSVVEGIGCGAQGQWAHAEGRGTRANGWWSHAEGYYSEVTADYGHAEGASWVRGKAGHAEGGSYNLQNNPCVASGQSAHAEGYDTVASGDLSHAQNRSTNAGYTAQTAIGAYNDNQPDTAFEIGNGTSTTARSNAFTVGWDGNVVASGNITASGNVGAVDVTASGNATADNFLIDLSDYQTAGSVDKELYDAIVALGWDSDVLVN